jgi:uncharacterized protein YqcC (DUF446 family)
VPVHPRRHRRLARLTPLPVAVALLAALTAALRHNARDATKVLALLGITSPRSGS